MICQKQNTQPWCGVVELWGLGWHDSTLLVIDSDASQTHSTKPAPSQTLLLFRPERNAYTSCRCDCVYAPVQTLIFLDKMTTVFKQTNRFHSSQTVTQDTMDLFFFDIAIESGQPTCSRIICAPRRVGLSQTAA